MAGSGGRLWTCPVCGRKFARVNQAHSHMARGVEDHFKAKDPRLKEIFLAMMWRLRETGPLRVDAVASGINLISKYHFGGITVRRDHLHLGFVADHAIHDEKIVH